MVTQNVAGKAKISFKAFCPGQRWPPSHFTQNLHQKAHVNTHLERRGHSISCGAGDFHSIIKKID